MNRVSAELGTVAVNASLTPSNRYISLESQPASVNPNNNTEAYSLLVDDVTETVQVLANSPAGAFYGVQSIISLASVDGVIAACSIEVKTIRDSHTCELNYSQPLNTQ